MSPSKVSFFLICLTFVVSSVSCSQNSPTELLETQPSLPTIEKTHEKLELAKASPIDIDIVKKYAETYEPKPAKGTVIPSPPEPSEKVLQVISNLKNSDSKEYEKYIVLIFLRLYRFHIENFKQSYELGRENPLTKEFFRIIKSKDFEKAELMPSYLAENYVEENVELLKYDLIEKEMKRIKKADEKIKKELKETTREQNKTGR